ncbi:MAG: serine protease, partial [Pseudomonadota bacterium]|nr:serine protease [Pseudomonadota bacterium]
FIPLRFHSECSEEELDDRLPGNDNEVENLHDLALLQLRFPAGAHLGTVKLAPPETQLRTHNAMMLVHYPAGNYAGISPGSFRKIRGLTARWGHTARTRGGSSGGACFDMRLLLAGIHQGKAPPPAAGRLVPASRFPQDLRDLIAADEAPPAMWSLDGTAEGDYVIGRSDFFGAFAAASRPGGRARGIRIKRIHAAGDVTGLPFSYLMLEQLVARSPELRLIRVSFETVVPDFADEVARRAAAIGIDVGTIAEAPGVASDETTPEAIAVDRARRVARLLDSELGSRCLRLWVFLDHPSVAFGEELRAAFEGFVDEALRLEQIRLVVAGFEAAGVPGEQFRSGPEALSEGSAGLVTEYLTGFSQVDVERFVRLAAEGLGRKISDERVAELVEEALLDLPASAGIYEPWRAADVAQRLRPRLCSLAEQRPNAEAPLAGEADHG